VKTWKIGSIAKDICPRTPDCRWRRIEFAVMMQPERGDRKLSTGQG
jgi:hypothetical protein